MRPLVAVLVLCAAAAAQAAGLLSEDQATRKAVQYLRGSAYGSSYYEILQHIEQTHLMTKGANDCGPVAAPQWAFHVHNPYDGWLFLDAASGEKACSSIPFLR